MVSSEENGAISAGGSHLRRIPRSGHTHPVALWCNKGPFHQVQWSDDDLHVGNPPVSSTGTWTL